MTDQAAANHAAVRILTDSWEKPLTKMNCHLHPLDSVSTCCRTTLKTLETESATLYGSDCMAGNLVLAINKRRYKDGKGDPQGFVSFVHKNKVCRGILPRCRWNRLHVIFHLCGKLVQYRNLFSAYFKDGASCVGLRKSILTDFNSEVAQTEMKVLGLL